jgi:hypothetical protein
MYEYFLATENINLSFTLHTTQYLEAGKLMMQQDLHHSPRGRENFTHADGCMAFITGM